MQVIKVSVIIPVYNVEPYIKQMLESVKIQTFEEFEVILINDGSNDNSLKIIEQFCREDDRFHVYTKINGGVSSARNKGLEIAKGEYVVFYDPDDYIPDNALEDLFKTAKRRQADLIVGMQEVYNLNDTHIVKATKNLASKIDISKFDKNFNWTFSVCNKMFRREVIQKHAIRFREIVNGEDGVFLFEYIHLCQRITGCRSIVYSYRKRPFWLEKSVTQSADDMALDGLLQAFQCITDILQESYHSTLIHMKENQAEQIAIEEFEIIYKEYCSDLYCRVVQLSFFGDFYCHIWRLTDELFNRVEEQIIEWKKHIFPREWENKIVGKFPELRLKKRLLMSKQMLSKEPLITFILSNQIPVKSVNRIVEGLYNQMFPAFEILAHESFRTEISAVWSNMINFRFISKEGDLASFKANAMKEIKGNFVNFIDEDMIVSRRLVKNMYLAMTQKQGGRLPDFITVSLERLEGDHYMGIPSHSAAFTEKMLSENKKSIYNQLDWMWGNKLFRVEALRSKKVLFSKNSIDDIYRLYNNSYYRKIPELSMITTVNDNEVLKNVKSYRVKLSYKLKLREEKHRKEKLSIMRQSSKSTGYRIKAIRNAFIRYGYEVLTKKILFPFQYKKYSHRKIENKAIFVEPRQKEMNRALGLLEKRVKEKNSLQVHEHFLGQGYARYRQQYKRTMQFIRDLATAKYFFMADEVDSIENIAIRKDTFVMQAWHESGAFRVFGISQNKVNREVLNKKRLIYRNYDLVTAGSEETVSRFEEAFGLEGKEIVKATGVSRTDYFFKKEFISAAKQRLHKLLPQAKDKKIIIYTPHYRGNATAAKGILALDIGRLSDAFSEEWILLIKQHESVRKLPEIPLAYKNTFAFEVTRSMEYEEVLCVGDICITDYSASLFDYSLLERPMIFFPFYLEENYDSDDFYNNYYDYVPGPVASSTEDVISLVASVDSWFDQDNIKAFRNKYMAACDGQSTERILSLMGI